MKVGRGYIPFIGRLVSEGPFMIGMDTLIRHKSLFSTNIQVALRPQYVKHRISNPEVGNSVELGSARSPRTGLVELFLWTYFGTTELRRIAILGGSSILSSLSRRDGETCGIEEDTNQQYLLITFNFSEILFYFYFLQLGSLRSPYSQVWEYPDPSKRNVSRSRSSNLQYEGPSCLSLRTIFRPSETRYTHDGLALLHWQEL